MGRGAAQAVVRAQDREFCGFSDDGLSTKFFGIVGALLFMLCFGLIEALTGSGKLPSSDQCSVSPEFMDYEGDDLVKGGFAIVDTAGQPGTLQCCQKCSVMPGAVMWVYHTPLAITGTETCYCKYAIGKGTPNQQYIAVKIADPAAHPWGGVFMTALSGAGLLYLAGGALINHQRGLRDIDMIPNGALWAGLPSLVIDGLMFASKGCSSSARAGYAPVGAESVSGIGQTVDEPSMLPDVESLGAQIMERDEMERKARKKAAKKSKEKRGSMPSLTDEMQREEDRHKLKEKDKRSKRKSHGALSPSASDH